jgi:aspartate/methionine/tyrosine aminotransferase
MNGVLPEHIKGSFMHIQEFKLERYYARYEFSARYMFSSSDCESLRMSDLLALAAPAEMRAWNSLSLGYTESQGLPELRTEISNSYERVEDAGILVAAPEEAIFIAMQTLLSAGDEVIVVSPAYQSLYEVARSNGSRVIPWELRVGKDGWQLDMDALPSLITPRTRMVVINFPHNPTGFLPDVDMIHRLVDIARSHNLIIFSDEMYRMLEPRAEQRLPALCDLYEQAVSLSGLSKAYALPGLRMGWLATQNREWIGRFLQVKDYTTICSSAPSELLALIAMKNRETLAERCRRIIQSNTDLAAAFFKEHADLFTWIPPRAGSVAFPKWKGWHSLDDFCLDLVEKTGVMIVPASMFEFPQPHFRAGLGRMNFPEALEHLETYLTTYHD